MNLTAGFDLQAVLEWIAHYRSIMELLALVGLSALLGFLTARSIYRSQVNDRTHILRTEQVRWRRRTSSSRRAAEAVSTEKTRVQRRLKQATRANVSKA
jgi:hypothetical protein